MYISSFNPSDMIYSPGTVVCPNASGMFVQCTHDNCPYAYIVSPDTPYDGNIAVAQAGQISARTAFDLAPRTPVVSDGRGGVRAAASGEQAYVIGFSVSETQAAQVPIILKSYFGVVS